MEHTGSLCSTGEHGRCWPHTTMSPMQGPPQATGSHWDFTCAWPQNTRPLQCPASPPVLLRSGYPPLDRCQQESAHRRSLLHSSGFRNILNPRIPLFPNRIEGSHTHKGLIAMKARLVLAAPPQPGGRWQPCSGYL